MGDKTDTDWLDEVNWNRDGLIPAIAQDCETGRVLTLAWMNREALQQTAASGRATYWSRSRGKIWQKGESSGHTQEIDEIYIDCDQDAIVLLVRQTGGIACHTGRRSCFYRRLDNGKWHVVDPVIRDPGEIYQEDA